MSEAYTCPNCGTINSEKSVYCEFCSQKMHLKLNSVWRMIGNFIATLIDYDSKLFSSIRGLFKPGYLTNQYLLRKRVRYLTPIRLFVIFMFSFFAVMTFQGFDKEFFNMNVQNSNGVDQDEINNKHYSLMEQSYQSLRFSLIQTLLEKEFEIKLLNLKKSIEKLDQKLNENLIDETKKKESIKKLKQRQEELEKFELAYISFKNMSSNIDYKPEQVFNIKFATVTYPVKVHDISQLSSDEIIDKYKINHWLDKVLVVQMLKFNKDSKAFGKFIFQNLTWVVIFDLLIMSAIFKLFYIRSKRKYVEHFIYNLNIRSWLFFTGIILMLLPVIYEAWAILSLSIAMSFYLILSLKNVYRQSLFVSIIKFILLTIIHFVVLLLVLILVVLVSSLIF